MANPNVHRRRRTLPKGYRAEVGELRQQFFTPSETGKALTAILIYAKLPANLDVCSKAFHVAAEVVLGWMRELPDPALSPQDIAHRCDFTAHRVQHALNWANSLLSRPPRWSRRTCDKDTFATRFITAIRDGATAALPVLNQAAEEARRRIEVQPGPASVAPAQQRPSTGGPTAGRRQLGLFEP